MLLKCLALLEFVFNYFLLHVVQVQIYDKARNALALALSPVVRALVDPDGAMRDIRNLDSVRMITFISGLWITSFVFVERSLSFSVHPTSPLHFLWKLWPPKWFPWSPLCACVLVIWL